MGHVEKRFLEQLGLQISLNLSNLYALMAYDITSIIFMFRSLKRKKTYFLTCILPLILYPPFSLIQIVFIECLWWTWCPGTRAVTAQITWPSLLAIAFLVSFPPPLLHPSEGSYKSSWRKMDHSPFLSLAWGLWILCHKYLNARHYSRRGMLKGKNMDPALK